jgi:hypothetical protein
MIIGKWVVETKHASDKQLTIILRMSDGNYHYNTSWVLQSINKITNVFFDYVIVTS